MPSVAVSYTHLDVYKRQVYSEFYGFFDGLKGVGPEEAVGLSAAETLREQFRICLLYTSRCV